MLTFSEVITARHVPTLCCLVLVVAIIATPVPTFAQGSSAPPTDLHRYPLPTYEEDLANGQMLDNTQQSVRRDDSALGGGDTLWCGAERRWRGFPIEVDRPRGDGSGLNADAGEVR
jgi:hypothetical protein